MTNQITRTINYINERIDQPLTIDELASNVGMSRAVFHRLFKEATKLSPIQYLKS